MSLLGFGTIVIPSAKLQVLAKTSFNADIKLPQVQTASLGVALKKGINELMFTVGVTLNQVTSKAGQGKQS